MLLLNHWLPWSVFYTTFAVNLVLDLWLLIMLHRQRVWSQLPWFVVYVSCELLSTLVGFSISLFSRKLYVTVFWCMEGARIGVMVAAVRESLLRIFRGFKRLLRWSVLTVIAAVVAYSAWKAVHAPPVQSNRLVTFILAAEFTFRWGVAAVALLSVGLMAFVQEPMGSREDAVVTGCGIASLAFVGNVLIRSFFGTRFTFLSQYLPDMGYFIAAWWWIRIFSRPVQEYGFKELGMGPEDIRRELRNYRESVERIMRKLS